MPRLLLIDDDELLRRVLASSLRHAGYDVVEAPDGRQGVDLFNATTFDIVVCDLVMPVQEGVETILKLRRAHPQLPIIAISGGVTNSGFYLDIASKIGAQRVLAKPFTPQELLHAIEELLAERDADREKR
jgi:DNA-binding response OmpR family regulator